MLEIKYLLQRDTQIDLVQVNMAAPYSRQPCAKILPLAGNHGPEIITNAVIYWFILPLCVYLQYVPVPLPSYTPLQLAYVNLPLT